MKYNVFVTVNVMPEEDTYSNSLTFTRRYQLEGDNFTDIARQVDFIYDTIQGKQDA